MKSRTKGRSIRRLRKRLGFRTRDRIRDPMRAFIDLRMAPLIRHEMETRILNELMKPMTPVYWTGVADRNAERRFPARPWVDEDREFRTLMTQDFRAEASVSE